MTHTPEPLLALHPRDAALRGLAQNDLARVANEHGSTVVRVTITEQQRLGDAFLPMHWTDQFSSAGVIGKLVWSDTDPISGQPDLKGSPVEVSGVKSLWTGRLLRRESAKPSLGDAVYWTKAPLQHGFTFELAGWTPLAHVISSEDILRRLLQIPRAAELVSYSDPKKSVFRYAGFLGDRLEACLFLAPEGVVLPSSDTATEFLGRTMTPIERMALLAAASAEGVSAADKIVCSCFSVGANRLASAIREKNLNSVAEIGAAMKAGTNCGSCIPELKKLLQDAGRVKTVLAPAD
jgi:assimilatory nitrate reductase catalytic subunit